MGGADLRAGYYEIALTTPGLGLVMQGLTAPLTMLHVGLATFSALLGGVMPTLLAQGELGFARVCYWIPIKRSFSFCSRLLQGGFGRHSALFMIGQESMILAGVTPGWVEGTRVTLARWLP